MTDVGPLVAVGRTSDVYEFGRGSVIKVLRPSVPSHWAAMEARFTAAVRELGAPAPDVRDVVRVEGRDAIVFERVSGQSMWDLMVASPQESRGLGVELAEVHKCILSAGVPTAVLGLVERMCAKIAEVEHLTEAERLGAQQDLRRLPRGAALLHGDLHPGNVLMTIRGPVVIDWFDAAIGHPIADVVRSSLLVRPLDVADWRPHLPGAPPGLLGELHESYVSAMSDVLSAPPDELCRWEAVVTASRLAEDAESDELSLLALWRGRVGPERSPLLAALSAVGSGQ
jgi:tRNA A-37 threonylcarbamoyl transferase component Bud32